ncbi:MAG TPA: hypothetical protein VGX76_11040 [Pirellulales bacterium]|jgi:hypothetical protein|nr:hypothetical protein [Pirellulales bacterium]
MIDPLVRYTPAPFAAPLCIQALLADAVVAANLPYEGLWVPVKYAKAASIEFYGSISTLAMDIWATNQPDPLNTYTVTVGGSETDGDILNLIFTNPLLPGGSETVSLTTSGGESTTGIATGLAAAVNADANLAALGFRATSAGAVVTITWPSAPGSQVTTEIGSPPVASTTILTTSKSGGATETLTTAVGADGQKLNGSSIAALALTNFTSSMPVAWIKARIGTLTGTGANITAALTAAA